jgi:hypothetical protein
VAGERVPDCEPVYGHHDGSLRCLGAGPTGWKYL